MSDFWKYTSKGVLKGQRVFTLLKVKKSSITVI